jgi:protein-S-isoprenylcysteine O-methyltransferase Ste14
VRNPFRAKNFDVRFLPAALAGGVLVLWSTPTARSVAFGAPLVVLGLAVRGWAVGHLVKTVRFTVTGPYAHLRHPLYLGTACIGLGLAIMLGGWAAVVGGGAVLAWFALSYLPRKERVETSRLLARHGEAYARYRREVPALWPRPRPWRPSPDVAAGVDLSGAWRAERFDANNELGTVIAVVLAVSAVSLRAALV